MSQGSWSLVLYHFKSKLHPSLVTGRYRMAGFDHFDSVLVLVRPIRPVSFPPFVIVKRTIDRWSGISADLEQKWAESTLISFSIVLAV